MRCQNCSWSWKIEKDDTHPFLCHKCGYDTKEGDFDITSFNEWKKENGYLNESDPKVGTGKKPKGSGRRLYTDENPKDTVSIKYATVQDARDSVAKVKKINKPFARKIQILTVGEQRSKYGGKPKQAEIFRRGKDAIRKKAGRIK